MSASLVLAMCQDLRVFWIRKIPLSITLALLKSLEWLLRQFYIFLHFKCVPFSLLKNTSSPTNVAPRTIGARNFIQHIGLKFNRRPKLEGREFLLQGLVWSSNNINSILSKMCEGFCGITNIRDSGHDGGFIFKQTEQHAHQFLVMMQQKMWTNSPRQPTKITGLWMLSSKPLSQTERCLLEKGPTFAPTPAMIPTKEIVCEIKAAVGNLPDVTKDSIRTTSAYQNVG